MKRVLFILIAVFSLMSCNKDDDGSAQAAIDDQLIRDYLEEHDLNATKDPSGLYYRIIKQGSSFPAGVSLKIKYTGMLLDKTVFDSGTTTGPLSYYIQGWKIGIPKIGVGGSGVLYIPSALAYGSSAKNGIPANSVLIFQVEVLAIN
nr:FKBP-type peptidyl-prolyl cis-trans isomerase [uncultured Carboxylicivirga sp.]